MSDGNFVHENLGLEKVAKIRQVRDKRFDSEENWTLKVETLEGPVEVLDYSAFGFKVFSKKDLPETIEASLFIDKMSICKFNLHRRWHDSLGYGNEYGFEVIGEPLDVGYLRGISKSLEVVKGIGENPNDNIPDAFKKIVYETTDFLRHLETQINGIEDSIDFVGQSERSSFNDAFCTIMGDYLSPLFNQRFVDLSAHLADMDKDTVKQATEFFRNKLSDFLYLSPFSDRSIKKPLGYAGDFDMMRFLYKNEIIGTSLFSKCVHRYYMLHPNAQAVRNRKEYIYGKINEMISSSYKGTPLRILSVACGPAEEVSMIIEKDPDFNSSVVEIDLLDQDQEALQYAKKNIRATMRKFGKDIKVNYLNKGIKNVIQNGLDEKYDLIYSAGLFDYFSDPVALHAAKQLYAGLNDKGALVIGNFKENAPDRALMELVLDWQLIYRDVDKLKELYTQTGGEVHVEAEDQTINLFAVIRKV